MLYVRVFFKARLTDPGSGCRKGRQKCSHEIGKTCGRSSDNQSFCSGSIPSCGEKPRLYCTHEDQGESCEDRAGKEGPDVSASHEEIRQERQQRDGAERDKGAKCKRCSFQRG